MGRKWEALPTSAIGLSSDGSHGEESKTIIEKIIHRTHIKNWTSS
jgi:hypothetical protein